MEKSETQESCNETKPAVTETKTSRASAAIALTLAYEVRWTWIDGGCTHGDPEQGGVLRGRMTASLICCIEATMFGLAADEPWREASSVSNQSC